MPGYDSKVVMAAGAFTLGSSIELSADAPIQRTVLCMDSGWFEFSQCQALRTLSRTTNGR